MRFRALLGGAAIAFSVLASSVESHAQPVTVELAYLPLLGSSQVFVMESEGWAKDAGLDFKMTRFNSGTAIVQALASGKFDIAIMAMSPVIVARAAGIDLKVVAAMHDIDSHAFIGTPQLAGAYAKAGTPAAAFAQFVKDNGRPVKIAALPKGTLPDTAIRFYLAHHKVAPEHFQILSQGDEQVLQSMLAGAVDAVSLAEPLMEIIKTKISGTKVLASGATLMPGHPGFVIAVREKFIAKNPEAVRKIVEMNVRATDQIGRAHV